MALDLAIDLYKIEKLLHEEIVEFNHNKELLQHKLEALSLRKNMGLLLGLIPLH